LYGDGSDELLKGCPCGGKLFFFVRDKKQIEEVTLKLNEEERLQIEKDVLELIGEQQDTPVILDLESIRVTNSGKYEIDLVQIFKGEPLVYKMDDGKYVIDIPTSFQMYKTRMKNKEKKTGREKDVQH
jgi:predicted  nucleic acid-binding Zn-ribbon protein